MRAISCLFLAFGKIRWALEAEARKHPFMAITLDILAKRLAALEQEVASLRQDVDGRLRRENGEAGRQQTINAAIAKAYAEMGIVCQAIDAKKLRELFLAHGIKPEENAFSRGIIDMREE